MCLSCVRIRTLPIIAKVCFNPSIAARNGQKPRHNVCFIRNNETVVRLKAKISSSILLPNQPQNRPIKPRRTKAYFFAIGAKAILKRSRRSCIGTKSHFSPIWCGFCTIRRRPNRFFRPHSFASTESVSSFANVVSSVPGSTASPQTPQLMRYEEKLPGKK